MDRFAEEEFGMGRQEAEEETERLANLPCGDPDLLLMTPFSPIWWATRRKVLAKHWSRR